MFYTPSKVLNQSLIRLKIFSLSSSECVITTITSISSLMRQQTNTGPIWRNYIMYSHSYEIKKSRHFFHAGKACQSIFFCCPHMMWKFFLFLVCRDWKQSWSPSYWSIIRTRCSSMRSSLRTPRSERSRELSSRDLSRRDLSFELFIYKSCSCSSIDQLRSFSFCQMLSALDFSSEVEISPLCRRIVSAFFNVSCLEKASVESFELKLLVRSFRMTELVAQDS